MEIRRSKPKSIIQRKESPIERERDIFLLTPHFGQDHFGLLRLAEPTKKKKIIICIEYTV